MVRGKRLFVLRSVLAILLYGRVPAVVSLLVSSSVMFICLLPVLPIIALFHANYSRKIVYSGQEAVDNTSINLSRWTLFILFIICVFRVFSRRSLILLLKSINVFPSVPGSLV